MYKANFCCRTALKILRVIGEFKVNSPEDLYQNIFDMEWDNYFDLKQSFSINCTASSDALNNATFVSLKTKDAIVDKFRSKYKKRPSFNSENSDFPINVFVTSDTLTVTLDSSGESLQKRGYRVGQHEASISEVLAAGILKIAGWKGQTDFYDTMCGSGTIPVEAALIARNIPPGIFRKEFAFESWKDFDSDLFEEVYNEDYEIPFEHKIYASDIATVNVKIASKNAKSAGVFKSIDFKEIDFAKFVPQGKSGLLLFHPPHGERKRDRERESKIEPLYKMIGMRLKSKFTGFKTWIFSGSEEELKSIGLRPSTQIKFYSGAAECHLSQFELYEGTKVERKPFERKPFERKPFDRQNRNIGDRKSSFGERKSPFGDRPDRSDRGGSRPRSFKKRDDA
jgi:putative N6-adenine-specific DNA methylase